MKPRETAATLFLKNAGILFTPYPYEYNPNAEKVGIQAALALGKDPSLVFKTLMCEADEASVCAIIPSDCELSLKKLARVGKAKSANMMKPDKAERITGFKVGGISPFGQRKSVLTFLDESAQLFDEILINGGARGLLIGIAPFDVVNVIEAELCDLTA